MMFPTNGRLFLAFAAIFFSLFLLTSCGGFRPYRAMAQAAGSPERPAVFAHDKRLKLSLRRALVSAVPESALSVSSYVSGGHAFLVGWTRDDAQRTELEEAARTVPGLLSVVVYLPVKPTGDEAPNSSEELELKTKVVAAIIASSGSEKVNIAVEVLGTHAVLVGAVRSTDAIEQAAKAANDTSGISGVTNFLSVPLESNAKRFGGFLPGILR